MSIIAILLRVGGGECHGHYVHKAKEVGLQSTKGVGSRHKGGQSLGRKVTVLQPNRVGS